MAKWRNRKRIKMVLFVDVIGFLGAGMILATFVASSLEKISRGRYLYMFNGGGAALLFYYGYVNQTWAFVLLNSVWLLIEIYYLYKKVFKGYKRK